MEDIPRILTDENPNQGINRDVRKERSKMKNKTMRTVRHLAVLGLVLAVSAAAQALPLHPPGLVFDTFDWSVGTFYADDEAGSYFRDANAYYYEEDGTKVEYDNTNPMHKLFTDLDVIVRDPSLIDPDEDGWGLLEIRSLNTATVAPIGSPQYPMIVAEDTYWSRGDQGGGDFEYLLGQYHGLEDQVVIIDATGNFTIYSDKLEFVVNLMDSHPGNPHFDILLPVDQNRPQPWDRVDADTTTNWNDNPGTLVMAGESAWYRFNGIIELDAGGNLVDLDGSTTVYLNVTDGQWNPYVGDYWPTPGVVGLTDIFQTWNVDDLTLSNWLHSEDTGRLTVIPEPLTMFAVFGSVVGLGGYIRKRRQQ